jgi:hypothetical protein
MATIEFIQKRIDGKLKEIATLEKKIARIEQAKATNWEKNPYYYSERDLTSALRDKEAAEHQSNIPGGQMARHGYTCLRRLPMHADGRRQTNTGSVRNRIHHGI